MEEDNKKKVQLKAVILGSANVGKTTLIHRYTEKQFKETISTLGASFTFKQWNSYSIAIWDTAGEERFRGLSSFYCRGAGAAIVAFDLTDEDSFHSIRALFLPLLDAALEDCVKIVIGTKLDLIESMGRAVSAEDGQTLAREINSSKLTGPPLYFETSSKTGTNVEQAFEALFKQCEPAMRILLRGQQGGAGDDDAAPQKKGCC